MAIASCTGANFDAAVSPNPIVCAPAGLFLANLAMLIFSWISVDQFLTWGWRIPFLLSIVMVGVGLCTPRGPCARGATSLGAVVPRMAPHQEREPRKGLWFSITSRFWLGD